MIQKEIVCVLQSFNISTRFVWFKLCIQIKKTQYQKQIKGRPKKMRKKIRPEMTAAALRRQPFAMN